jgi:hypothetical protein
MPPMACCIDSTTHTALHTPTLSSDQRLSFPSAFADAYDLGLRLPTQWCASSTTHAALQALGRVLEVLFRVLVGQQS